MTSNSTTPDDRDARLEQVLAEYLHAAEAGQPPDQQQLLDEHPDLADELRSFFANRAALERIAEPLKGSAYDPTMGLGESSDTGDATRVRYFGDYELLEEIARGGMGVVYRAKQTSLNRAVALKMILAGQLASDADVQRFHAEAEAAANLDHPNIVPIYEVGKHEDQHYFSMKLIEGTSLSDELSELRDDAKRAVRVLTSVARAVHHAHQRGILHRDLKPGNILMDADGQPHVTDFGLAKRVEGDSDLTASGAILGTPAYMAPEQAMGEKDLSTAVDVYSLGAILFQMLTCRAPFQGESPMAVLMKVIEEQPATPSSMNKSVSRDLETICLKCLEKSPDARYDSAAALGDDLERWLRGEPISARPVSSLERSWRWCRRNPAVSILGLLSILLLVAGTVVSTVFAIRAETRADEAEFERQRAELEKDKAIESERMTQLAREQERDARNEAGRASYVARITLASRGWEAGKLQFAQYNLQAVPPERRRWEHHYLSGLAQRCEQTLFTARGGSDVSFSPDGQRILGAGGRVWNSRTGNEIFVFPADSWAVFTPDGKRLIVSGERPTQLFDAATGEPQFTLPGLPGKTIVRPDGEQLLVIDSVEGARLHDARTGELIRTIPAAKQSDSADFSPDGKRIVFGGFEGDVRVCDAESDRLVLELPRHIKKTSNQVNLVAFSSDGRSVVSLAAFDGTVRVSDAQTGAERFILPAFKVGADHPRSAAFAPDSQRLATGHHDGGVRLWDAQTGGLLFTLKGHTGAVLSLAFSPDGRRLISSGNDLRVIVWDWTNDRGYRTFVGHEGVIRSVRFTPDSQQVVSAGDDRTVRIWDAATGRQSASLTSLPVKMSGVDVTPDGREVVAWGEDNQVRRWRFGTAEPPQSIEVGGAWVREQRGIANLVVLSPDGRYVAAGYGGAMKVHELETGKELAATNGGLTVGYLAWSPDGKRLAHADVDSRKDHADIGVWEWETSQDTNWLASWRHGLVQDMSFSPNGKKLAVAGAIWGAGSDLGAVIVYDTEIRRDVMTLLGHLGRVLCVTYNRDGDRLITGSEDGEVKLWNVDTGQEMLTLAGDGEPVRSVAASADGKSIAAAGDDSRVRVWSAEQVSLDRMILKCTAHIRGAAYLPGGEKLVSADDSAVVVWDLKSGDQVWSSNLPSASRAACASRNGRLVAVGRSDGAVTILDAKSGAELSTLNGFQYSIRSVSFSPDGELVAASSEGGVVRLWRREDGQNLHTLSGHARYAVHLSFTPDGGKLIVCYDDGLIKVWDPGDAAELLSYQAHDTEKEGYVRNLLVSPEGDLVLSDCANTGKAYSLADGQTRFTYKGNVKGFPSDGRTALVMNGFVVRKIDLQTGAEVDQENLATNDYELFDSLLYFSPEGHISRLAKAEGNEVRAYLAPPELHDARAARLARMAAPSIDWHEQQTAEAIAEKRRFAAIWHLNAALTLAPERQELRDRLQQVQVDFPQE